MKAKRMSCCFGTRTNEQDYNISKQIKQESRKIGKEYKLLLLGTGDSGKSTIAKQFRILYTSGYTVEERCNFIPAIHSNLIYCTKELLKGAKRFGYELDVSLKESIAMVLGLQTTMGLSQSMAEQIKYIWMDPAICSALARRNELQLVEHVEYLFDKIDKYVAPNYVPTIEDILRVRVRTTGIVELKFSVESIVFRVMDMGGQRAERRKWIHFFEGATAVVYVVALNEYNLVLREDGKVNRMHESLELFREISNNEYFRETPVILFLNKCDLFKEKIKRESLKTCFPEYEGGTDYEQGWRFIGQKFHAASDVKSRPIYAHVICATDTDTVRTIFADVRSCLINDSLVSVGIM